MKVAVVGANGQLGTDLVDALSGAEIEATRLNHDEIEVADLASVRRALAATRPRVVLNTAAYHDLADCERHPERAFAVNALGAFNLARATTELGIRNVYFSTDYVFDGLQGKPYIETDAPRPLNVYAASKLAGERVTLSHDPAGLVVRVSGLYGRAECRAKPGRSNFVDMMVALAAKRPQGVKATTDEVLAPTSTRAVAGAVIGLLGTDVSGVLHLACEGACSRYEFTRELFDTLGIETPLGQAVAADFEPSELDQRIARPLYTVLENDRLHATGLPPMPNWREALRDYLAHDHRRQPVDK